MLLYVVLLRLIFNLALERAHPEFGEVRFWELNHQLASWGVGDITGIVIIIELAYFETFVPPWVRPTNR